MGQFNETVRTVNSAVRTLLIGALIAGAGFAGWQGYSFYYRPQQEIGQQERKLQALRLELERMGDDLADRDHRLVELQDELQVTQEQLQRVETSLRLLKLNHRIARIEVVEQATDPETEQLFTTVEFYEVNDEGAPLSSKRRTYKIEGDRIYVECLVAKFEDQYVERSDLDRATAICLFQRIFGEFQQPQEGFELDEVGSRPTSYARGGKVSEFEQQIWNDFWNIANDPHKAAEIGIRAAHADAPSTQVRKGATYQLEIRATGEFTLRRLQDDQPLSADGAPAVSGSGISATAEAQSP